VDTYPKNDVNLFRVRIKVNGDRFKYVFSQTSLWASVLDLNSSTVNIAKLNNNIT